ncbi:MAG TPA: glutamate racemase [Burkholderiales bacterium]|nr:glutamate racemase [Burkholderiales bacterium]
MTIPVKNAFLVGVFDSGVGGLSVLKEVRALLPQVDLLYVADSGHVPYGEKSPEYILARSKALTEFLLSQGARVIVVACNTATAAAVTTLRAEYAIPIIGMEPAVKPAVAATRTGKVGVLATTGTLASAKFAALLTRYRGDKTILTEPCPGWVDAVERGELSGPDTEALVARHVKPLLAANVDALILGCTHYPFLRPVIESIAGPQVIVVDTGAAVARQVKRKLEEMGETPIDGRHGRAMFYTTGNVSQARATMMKLWHDFADVDALPER